MTKSSSQSAPIGNSGSSPLFQRDPEEINAILSDENFVHLVQIIEKIAVLNDTVPHEITEDNLNSLLEDVNEQESIQGVISKFAEWGIQNTDSLQSLFNEIVPTIGALLNNEALEGLETEAMEELLKESFEEYFKENPFYHFPGFERGDICSSAYASGMEECDDNFAIATAATVFTAAVILFGSAGTGLFGAGAAVGTGIGGAYAALYVCQRSVVAAWRLCRQEHPI